MDEKRLEQEYRKLKHQALPDLWDRIEANLTEHPERMEISQTAGDGKQRSARTVRRRNPVYGMAAAAAAVAVLIAAVPQMNHIGHKGSSVSADTELLTDEESGRSVKMMPDGVVDYGQLELAAYRPIKVPEQAVSVPEDTRYFSEAVLSDTELLCRGTVTSAALEEDDTGKAVKVVYEMTLDQVYYSEDYTTGMDHITVKSPIVKADGDEVYILYQLQQGGSYILPLRKEEADWELIYPFAPQIQVTGDGAYLFHTGYASLVNDEAALVVGSPESANDYYYDRMLLRKDDNFLSDFVTLVESQVQGRNEE